jgi:hypothetical protein
MGTNFHETMLKLYKFHIRKEVLGSVGHQVEMEVWDTIHECTAMLTQLEGIEETYEYPE